MSSSAPIPGRIASAMDVAVAISGVLAFVLLCTGAFRDVVGGTVISIGWMHAAFAAAGLTAIRHAAFPRPTIAASFSRWCESVRQRPALADAMLAFWVTRPTVLLVGLLATATIGVAPAAKDALLIERDPARGLPARWDAQWYAGLAAHGYEWQRSFDPQQNLAFFPAYPLLIRSLGVATGAFRAGTPPARLIARLTWCGLWISLFTFFWAARYFAKLAREMMDDTRARIALLLLSAYPFALFFSAAYTESLFLLTALGAWFHFRRGEHLAAAGWGLLAGLTRPNGCFLSIPLGLLALGVRDAPGDAPPANGLWLRLLVAASPGLGMLLFTAYLYQMTGIWFVWSKTHAAWGRVLGNESQLSSFTGFGPAGLFGFATEYPYDLLNGLGLLFALLPIRTLWRFSPAWAVFVLVSVAVPLAAGGLLSMGRLTSTLFPIFLACGLSLSPRIAIGATAGFAILQGLLAALFYTWRGMY
jgi:Mannosyltransferase (PIG-V)